MLLVTSKTFECSVEYSGETSSFYMEIRAKNVNDINSYIFYLVDEDGLLYCKEAAITNHLMQGLPSSLMNSLESKEDVVLFQMHYME